MGTLEILREGPIGLFVGVVLFLVVGGVLSVLIGIPYRLFTGRDPEESKFVPYLAFAVIMITALVLSLI